jgi:hypothetical protein
MKKIAGWWFTGLLFFGAIFVLAADLIWFTIDDTLTISYRIQQYCGGSPETLRAAVLGLIFGILLAHFTGFGATPPDESV